MNLRALIAKWRNMADSFELTRGDSEVENAYNGCAQELEAALAKAGETSAEHKFPEYPHDDPTVQALERGYRKWEESSCHDIGCGCVTVWIWRELVAAGRAASGEHPTIEAGQLIPATINGEPGRVAFFSQEAAKAHGFKLAAPAAAQELSEEQVKQCEHEADMEMIKRAPKIGEPRKLRYDTHVERRQILTEKLNVLLRSKGEPVSERREGK